MKVRETNFYFHFPKTTFSIDNTKCNAMHGNRDKLIWLEALRLRYFKIKDTRAEISHKNVCKDKSLYVNCIYAKPQQLCNESVL